MSAVLVEDDSGVLWAYPDRDRKTLEKFFDRLGEDRYAVITLVSADAAEWIANAVRAPCRNAKLCLDPFHIVAWAIKALDEVRREVWNAADETGRKLSPRGRRVPVTRCGITRRISPNAKEPSSPRSPRRTNGPEGRLRDKNNIARCSHSTSGVGNSYQNSNPPGLTPTTSRSSD